jgi:osmotically-inducible protein OsmY
MTTATLTATDLQVREAVIQQLDWDPEVDSSGIGVAADEGAVTLTGFIDSYAGKLAAERAAKRVRGVRAVANDIQVRLRVARADDLIAKDIAHALAMRVALPSSIQATVHSGHVTLTGQAPWLFHRGVAETAVRHVPGVIEVINRIEIRPLATYKDVRHRITETLHRIADLNAKHVVVTVKDTTCTLSGHVSSWGQRDAAQRAAEQAPGITRVENLIAVIPGEL